MDQGTKITIITVVKNAYSTIEQALQSINSQTYPNVEHIILDGVSTDGTLELIERFAKINPKVKFRSQKDAGMYAALNEGIKMATGDVIGFLHADDFFTHPRVLESVAQHFHGQTQAVYGDLVYVDPIDTENVKRFWQAGPFKKGAFAKGWHPPHTALFIKKSVYDSYGLFDTKLPIGNDVELMMRFFEKYHIKSTYVPQVWVKMRMGGISNRSVKNILNQNKVIMKAFKQNNIKVSWPSFVVHKGINRFKQFVTMPKKVSNVG